MRLVKECTLRIELDQPLPVGAGPIGTRIYYGLSGGTITGERLNGKLVAGGEWALIGPDGYLRVDVRAQVETHDGAHIYVQYIGLLEMNEAVQRAIETEGATQISDQHFYVNPRMETGDERYAWVNTTFFVGEGRIAAGLGVEYQIWRPA